MPQNASRAPGVISCKFRGRRPYPIACCAHGYATHRPSRPGIRQADQGVLEGIKTIFKTTQPVMIYPATGTGAWEAALVNTLSPGDRVLMVETGQFATLWKKMAESSASKPELSRPTGAHGTDPAAIEAHLRDDKAQRSRRSACCTTRPRPACLSPIAGVRKAIDAPAIRRSAWSTRSLRSPRPTIATTNGASTSPSAARKRA